MSAALRLQGLKHGYGALPVLEGVDLEVAAGEIVAVLGPSGCGKTTLLRLAAGLIAPQSGYVAREAEPGMAFQEPRLLPWYGCLENVCFGVARPAPADRQRAGELLARFGLAGYEQYKPAALSGGMAQRVSLARALLGRPRLLLLDEPLAGMDYFGRLELEDRLAETWRQEQPAVLLVTHDLEEAIYLADRIVILSPRPGRIVKEIAVGLPRPRQRAGKELAGFRMEVLAALGSTAGK